MEKVYSKDQMQISALLLGPIGAIYFLKKNFDVLGNRKFSQNTAIYGILGTIAIQFLLISTIFKAASIVPIAMALGVGAIYHSYQITLHENPKHSNWSVLGISIIGFILFAAMVCAVSTFCHLLGFMPSTQTN